MPIIYEHEKYLKNKQPPDFYIESIDIVSENVAVLTVRDMAIYKILQSMIYDSGLDDEGIYRYKFTATKPKGPFTNQIQITGDLFEAFNVMSSPFMSVKTQAAAVGAVNGFKKVGWKAHLAIDDSVKRNLSKAWAAIHGIVDKELVIRIAPAKSNFFKMPVQRGKQITIYCHETPGKDWEDVFNRIENALFTNDIKADQLPLGNKRLAGSRYISYRNDDNGHGKYAAPSDHYNPSGHADIFEKLELQPCGVRFRC